MLVEADGDNRLLACTLWQPGIDTKPVYVHAKIGIVDDRWLTTTHRLVLLPHVSRRSKGLLGPLNGFFVDG